MYVCVCACACVCSREDILAGVDKEITKGVLTSGVDVNDTFLLMAASMYLHQQVTTPIHELLRNLYLQ